MNRKKIFFSLILLLYYFVSAPYLNAQTALNIPSVFSDNMVLQRDMKIPVWGKAEPGSKVTITLNLISAECVSDENGNWKTELAEMQAGGPYALEIYSGKSSVKLSNVLIGDVWICSGQSNMNMPLGGWGRIKNYKKEISEADYPNIRLLTVPLTLAPEPMSEVETEGWKICTPENIEEFSAAAYFFGRELNNTQNIPIGLIHSSKGGTPVESWMSRENLNDFLEFDDKIKFITDDGGRKKYDIINKKYRMDFKDWMELINMKDSGLVEGNKWYEVNYDDSGWMRCEVPGIWENNGLKGFDGVVWFRKKISLPDSWRGKKAKLFLGPVDDMDITFFNGEKIGEQESKNNPSNYVINENLVKAGENILAVRVLDVGGNGGIWGLPDEIYLQNETGEEISLTGVWEMSPSVNIKSISKQPVRPNLDRYPVVLYNGMINPLIHLRIKGALWYQGESNAERAYQYRSLFPRMIKEWRAKWGEGDFPFYFVQLARYKSLKTEPADDSWAELREAQAMALSLPNTGMAVIIDSGDSLDVHPKDKQLVGHRLALIARNKIYNENIEYSGPVYKTMEIKDGKIILQFDHAGDGLITEGNGELKGFAIAGNDQKFVWANAEIKNDTVIVWNDAIENPVAVRYAWASNPVCNLYNKNGLPAVPFRTDNWSGVTINKK